MRWISSLAGGVLPCMLSCGVAQAVPIGATPVVPGTPVVASVAADTGPFAPADGWRFFTFEAGFGDVVTVTVTGLTPGLDAVLGVWYGTEADTDAYFDMASDSLASTWMGFGDDELPGFNPRVQFTSYLAGTFTVAVADHALTPGGGGDFQLAVSVPEPQTYALMAAGLAAVGFVGARRRRA